MKSLNIVIVGAGMGGLEAALALVHEGHRPLVLEAAPEFAEVKKGQRQGERIGL
jgi:2-polyprenyl-6-methoxyphenol hydroxylase-like FAD-dependent oxidoreductase